MSNNIWPTDINGHKWNKPLKQQPNQYTIDGVDLLEAFESNPQLFCFMQENNEHLEESLNRFITNICHPFIPEVLKFSLGRIKMAMDEFQEEEINRYVCIQNFKCAPYNSCILPFHDEHIQYQSFFVNIRETVRQNKLILHAEDTINSSIEHYIFTSKDNIEIIYDASATDDDKHRASGMKDIVIKYLKSLCNDRLDEIEGSSEDIFRVFFLRLRGKVRQGRYGKIHSVQGIISPSQWEIVESKISEVVEEDEKFDTNESVTSYKLTRAKLFGGFAIDSMFLIRVFDQYGKEMKMQRSLSDTALYDDDATGYTQSMKSLIFKIEAKFQAKNKIITKMSVMNGCRVTYNAKRKLLKLTTNSFQGNIGNINEQTNHVQITRELGRKRGW